MARICIMRFICDVPCAVSCDDLFIGCTEDDGLTAAIPCGNHFFRFTPFSAEGYSIPLAMYIDVCAPTHCPQGISLRRLPDGELHCRITFPVIHGRLPYIMSKYDDGQYSCAVYEDNGVNASFLRGGVPLSALRLKDSCKSCSTHAFGEYLIATADDTVVTADTATLKDIRTYKGAQYAGGTITQGTPHPDGLSLRISLADSKTDILPPPKDNHPAVTLALSVLHDRPDLARSALTRSLWDSLSFEDICQFFGDFLTIEADLCQRDRLALGYESSPRITDVRYFNAELSPDGRICNLGEE